MIWPEKKMSTVLRRKKECQGEGEKEESSGSRERARLWCEEAAEQRRSTPVSKKELPTWQSGTSIEKRPSKKSLTF